jgi:ketosteroid isomerase-like protein
MSEQDRDVVRRLIDALDRHDFDALDGILAEDFAWHGSRESPPLGGR